MRRYLGDTIVMVNGDTGRVYLASAADVEIDRHYAGLFQAELDRRQLAAELGRWADDGGR